MTKDLFQIGTEKGIYLKIDSWAMLSPKLNAGEFNKTSGELSKKEAEEIN